MHGWPCRVEFEGLYWYLRTWGPEDLTCGHTVQKISITLLSKPRDRIAGGCFSITSLTRVCFSSSIQWAVIFQEVFHIECNLLLFRKRLVASFSDAGRKILPGVWNEKIWILVVLLLSPLTPPVGEKNHSGTEWGCWKVYQFHSVVTCVWFLTIIMFKFKPRTDNKLFENIEREHKNGFPVPLRF